MKMYCPLPARIWRWEKVSPRNTDPVKTVKIGARCVRTVASERDRY